MQQSMSSRHERFLIPLTLLLLFFSLLFTAPSLAAQPASVPIWALNGAGELIRFDAATPRDITWRVAISNLKAGESLVGIDFRPSTGRLYGVGSTSQLYVIDVTTGFASPIGAPFSTPLAGSAFGVDFNPAVDRLRIVSNSGQNLRVNPDTGALVMADRPLAYAAGDVNAGATPQVVGAAYLNPDNDPATPTTLYNIDTALNTLVTQTPPNDGVLNTVARLRLDLADMVGFDIGPASAGAQGYLAFQRNANGPARLYKLNLANGRLSTVDKIGRGETINGLAVEPGAARYEALYALNSAGELLGFRADEPGTIRTRVAISNLKAGESLVGIDFRPSTGRLYGVSSTSQLYVINHNTGLAEAVGVPFSTPLAGSAFGVDFNPAVDRLRIVSDSGQNLRVNPDTGALVMADRPLAYATGDSNAGATPQAVGAAYLNPDNDPTTPTTLYNIDSGLDILVTQAPPNDGVLNTVGALGVDVGDVLGFDISRNDDSLGMAALAPAGSSAARLYCVNLSSGALTDRGVIGTSETITGFAVAVNRSDRSECR